MLSIWSLIHGLEGNFSQNFLDISRMWAQPGLVATGAGIKLLCVTVVRIVEAIWGQIGPWLAAFLTWIAYKVAEKVPALQIITLGTQWGDVLKNLYFLFARQDYWGLMLKPKDLRSPQERQQAVSYGDPDEEGTVQIENLSFLLISLLIDRLDFTLRVVLSLIYGPYWLKTPSASEAVEGAAEAPMKLPGGSKEILEPLLFSNTGYIDLGDGQTQVETNPTDNATFAKHFSLTAEQRTGLVHIGEGVALDDGIVRFLVEPSWLAYEPPRLIADMIEKRYWLRTWDGSPEKKAPDMEFICALEFISVTYKYDDNDETVTLRPIDTQCFIFKVGNSAVLAFRGSQPVNFFDWFYNLSVNTLPEEKKKAEFKPPNYGPNEQPEGSPRMHAGFAANLGLQLTKHNGTPVKPLRCCYFKYPYDAGQVSPKVKHEGVSPYDVIVEEIKKLTKKQENLSLYITGHSLGGATALVFAANFCQDDVHQPPPERTFLCTYGQPLVGNKAFVDNIRNTLVIPGGPSGNMETHYIRVVNQNDIVPRVGVFFLDNGERFFHLGGKGTVRYIGGNGVMETVDGDLPLPLPLQNPVRFSWLKLKAAWGFYTAAAVDERANRQSAWRFLVRAALTPVMLINDHIDYRLLMKMPGYWAPHVPTNDIG
jgi:hypothetical protein